MIAAGYSMHLYCRREGCQRRYLKAVGETFAECKAEARGKGWRFVRTPDGLDVECPDCSAGKRRRVSVAAVRRAAGRSVSVFSIINSPPRKFRRPI